MKTKVFIVLMIALINSFNQHHNACRVRKCYRGGVAAAEEDQTGGTGILYIAGYTNNCILVYDNANTREGSTSPDRLISGEFTQINHPNSNSLFIDAQNDKLYVCNDGNHSVLVFDNASTLEGNVTPEQMITYAGMKYPEGISVRTNRIYVADVFHSKLFVFSSEATGPTLPLATIEATSVGLAALGVYVDSNNNMYLAGTSNTPQVIYVFKNVNTYSSGNNDLVPDRIISCEALYNYPFAVWVDENKNILYADNCSASDILTFNNASTLSGECNYSSSAEISGNPYPLAVDTNKNILYVSNAI